MFLLYHVYEESQCADGEIKAITIMMGTVRYHLKVNAKSLRSLKFRSYAFSRGDAGGFAFVECGSSLRNVSNMLLALTYNRNNAINQT
jgi:hypothetical protein